MPAIEMELPSLVEAVPEARRLLTSALGRRHDDLLDDAKLVVTELVTNAVLHGQPPLLLRVEPLERCVRVQVADSGRALPLLRSPAWRP